MLAHCSHAQNENPVIEITSKALKWTLTETQLCRFETDLQHAIQYT